MLLTVTNNTRHEKRQSPQKEERHEVVVVLQYQQTPALPACGAHPMVGFEHTLEAMGEEVGWVVL